jgi:uncharacterized membrane protein YfcA
MLDLQYLWAFVLIVVFAAFAQGFMGLGFGIIVMAGVAFTPWDIERASVLTNILLLVLNSTIIFAGRRDFRIDWKLVGLIISGEICGVPLGYWFIYALGNRPVFRLALGIVLVVFAADRVFRPRLAKPLPALLGIIAGVIAGFLAGAFTAAGPPLALFIYSRHHIPAKAKGTLQVVFMSATLWRLITIFLIGKGVSLHLMEISAMMVPAVIFFAVLGHFLTRRVSSALFEKVVYTFIGLAGVLNIVRFFL